GDVGVGGAGRGVVAGEDRAEVHPLRAEPRAGFAREVVRRPDPLEVFLERPPLPEPLRGHEVSGRPCRAMNSGNASSAFAPRTTLVVYSRSAAHWASRFRPICWRSSAFTPMTASRRLPAIIDASSIVFFRSSAHGTRWFKRPMRWASSASTMRAEKSSSLAMGQPTWFGSVHVLLMRPYAAARNRNFECSWQPMRMSSDDASTAAPPYARPFIIPMVGLGHALIS